MMILTDNEKWDQSAAYNLLRSNAIRKERVTKKIQMRLTSFYICI